MAHKYIMIRVAIHVKRLSYCINIGNGSLIVQNFPNVILVTFILISTKSISYFRTDNRF